VDAHNSKAWMTQVLLHDWYFCHFQTKVKTYLIFRGLPPNGILFLDNAPEHPLGLQQFSESNPDPKVVFYFVFFQKHHINPPVDEPRCHLAV